MDLFDVEVVEAQLDAITERRAREFNDAERAEELWKESTRVHRERRRQENAEAWRAFHRHMQELHATLSEEHRTKAEGLLGAEPGAVS
ncbi:MAG: hypothetical protein H0X71_10235 [Rubrobacter sp.]|nr:hypothetical protein [Rubrobacter sp.]